MNFSHKFLTPISFSFVVQSLSPMSPVSICPIALWCLPLWHICFCLSLSLFLYLYLSSIFFYLNTEVCNDLTEGVYAYDFTSFQHPYLCPDWYFPTNIAIVVPLYFNCTPALLMANFLPWNNPLHHHFYCF